MYIQVMDRFHHLRRYVLWAEHRIKHVHEQNLALRRKASCMEQVQGKLQELEQKLDEKKKKEGR